MELMAIIQSDWTVTVEGGEPIPCEFTGENSNGLKQMTFTVHGLLLEHLGRRVRFRLAGGSRAADGEGLVVDVTHALDRDESTIIADGPLRMVAGS